MTSIYGHDDGSHSKVEINSKDLSRDLQVAEQEKFFLSFGYSCEQSD
jgi:hypothetical protein